MKPTTGIEFILTHFKARAQGTIAGAPAVAASSLWEALEASPHVRATLAADEPSAGLIAQQLARTSGDAAVCLVTAGAGVAHLAGAIAKAWMDATPMVCIALDSPPGGARRTHRRRIRGDRVVESITKANFRARDVDELIDLLPEAFRIAEGDDAGPVLLELATGALEQRTALRACAA